MRHWMLGLAGSLIFIVLSTFGYGQETVKKLSLKKAQEYAVTHNKQSQNARLDVEISQKEINETTARGFPQISGEATFQHYLDRPTQLIPAEFFGGRPGELAEVQFGTDYDFTTTLTGTQLIFDGTYIVGVQAAKTYAELRRKQQQKTETDVKDAVARAYYAALTTKRQVNILQSSLKSLKQTYQETKALYENGFVEDIEVDRLKLSVSNIENRLQGVQRQQRMTRLQLKLQLGMPLKDSLQLTDQLDDFIPKNKAEPLPKQEFQYKEHIEYDVLQKQQELRKLDIRKNQMAYLPSISGFINYRQNAQRDEFNFFDTDQSWYPTTVWGVKLQIPIFTSFQRAYRIKQARLQLAKVKNQQWMIGQSLKLEVKKAKTDYLNAYESYRTQQENLKLAKRIYDKTTVKYKEGVSGSADLASAERDYLDTQNQYINTLYNLLLKKAALKKALNAY